MISKLKVAWQEGTTRASECCRGSKRSGQLHATRTAAFSDCQGLVWVDVRRRRLEKAVVGPALLWASASWCDYELVVPAMSGRWSNGKAVVQSLR